MENRSDRFTLVEDRNPGYTVVDRDGSKIGKVDGLFLDENDRPEYYGVRMGFLGTSSTLIPTDITSVDEHQGYVRVSQPKETVKDGPAFDDDREITPEYENEVRSYYGLGAVGGTENRAYGDYYGVGNTGDHSGAETTGSTSTGIVDAGMSMSDTESGEFREHDRDDEGVNQSRGADLEDEDELRVQRSEEKLRPAPVSARPAP